VREAYREALGEVRKEAIGLADAWDFSDHSLNSCLGRKDGNVYEALYNRAKQDPLNQPTADMQELFDKYLKPVIHSKL
jgi:acyl-CoA oxidase